MEKIFKNNVETQRSIIEATKLVGEIENPALKRCIETPSVIDADPEKLAKQAYDRMYHTHNRA